MPTMDGGARNVSVEASAEAPHPSGPRHLMRWLMRVDSQDPSILRRARTFIPLLAVLGGLSALSAIGMIFAAPSPFVQVQWMIVIASIISDTLAVLLARKGWMNVAGIIVTARELSTSERAELREGTAHIFQKGQADQSELIARVREVTRR